MRFESLDRWLEWQMDLHDKAIELGLDRVGRVADRLGLDKVARRVITVAGTNGKGSSVAAYETWLHRAGYTVASYTSPHLLTYNERVKHNLEQVSGAELCAAFDAVESVRQDTALTYFEFGTLAALYLIRQWQPDYAILEVGLGGRLDAVNIIAADLVHLTPIGLDHQAWLGNDREQIGYEKAGIFRPDTPAVCGHPDMPSTVKDRALAVNAKLIRIESDFGYQIETDTDGSKKLNCWGLVSKPSGANYDFNGRYDYSGLAFPALPVMNASTAIQVAHLLGFPVSEQAINTGLQANLTGRYQRIDRGYTIILDVGHNPEAVEYLYVKLSEEQVEGKIYGLLGILDDKDSDKIIRILTPLIDSWFVTELNTPRTQSTKILLQQLKSITRQKSEAFDSVAQALSMLDKKLASQDLLVIFGSFYTVNAALDWLDFQDREQKL